MKLLLSSFLAIALTTPSFAHEIPKGRVAELGLHRLERLVILQRIEGTFQNRATSISIETLTPADHATDPNYKVEIAQGAATDGTKKTLVLMGDHDGRFVSSATSGTADPAVIIEYPIKDATTLLEVALHCVQGEAVEDSELCAQISEMRELNNKFETASLSPVRDGSGSLTGARVEVTGTTLTYKAMIDLTLDGKLNGANPVQIVPVGGVPPIPSPALESTFSSIRDRIFMNKCATCHQTGGLAENVPLTNYRDLLASPLDLVLAGNPDESGLVLAVERTDRRQMPPASSGIAPLTTEEKAAIRQWIQSGATENR